MNKRITIVDSEATVLSNYVGIGLSDVFSVKDLVEMDDSALEDLLSLTEGDGILAVGPSAFELIRKFYHLGIRGENYYDCSILNRLGTEVKGAYIKVLHEEDEITKDIVDYFLSPDFCKTRDFSDFRYEVVKTYDRAKIFLDFFFNLPVGVRIGFDYETSGMAMEKIFKITGAAFAIASGGYNSAVFFSFTELERNCTPKQFQEFRDRFKDILVKHHDNMWVYNMAFESQVTWREFGVELTFCDSSVFNYEDGLHQKNFSLKWTAQRLLGGGDKYHLPGIKEGPGIEPWDTDFDRLEDAFSRLYWVDQFVKGKKKPVGKLYKCSEYDWELQPEWKEINKLYPGYENEFRTLVKENFGNPFLNIPADILGKYCCLDSYYTVLIAEENLPRYSKLCHETFLNNLHIYAMTERSGLFIDDDYRKRYERYCEKMMLWGILYVSTYRSKRELENFKNKAANLEKYPKFSKLLIEKGEFCKGDTNLIARNLLAQNVDPYDNYDTGLDEGGLVLKYGNEFASGLVRIVKESIEETKFKGKIDSTIARKKKILGSISEKLIEFLGINKIKFGTKHDNLEGYLSYYKAYCDLLNVWKQIPNIDNVPDELYWRGKKCTVLEVANLISEEYYRCSSPIDNVKYEQEFISEYKLETTFLATIGRDVNKLNGEKKFYSNLGIKSPKDALAHFGSQCQVYYDHLNPKTGICLWPESVKLDYPLSTFDLFRELYDNPLHEFITDTWGDFAGYDKQADFFPELVNEELTILGENWKETDLELDSFTRMRKLLISILLYKKYNKILGTYICDSGIFSRHTKYVIEEGLMPIRDADESEEGAVKKSFVRYEICHKSTKRSSGPFHVTPGADFRKLVKTADINRNGKRTASILTYFDISSAEVRALAYRSSDQNMIHLFETGQDIYLHVCKQMLGEERFNALSKSEKKKWRKTFKRVVLASNYRQSAASLGVALNEPTETAQKYLNALFSEFPQMAEFINKEASYPINHNGYINTELGDVLRCPDYRFLYEVDRFGRKRRNNRIVSKLDSQGINYKIQSFSALSLAASFDNMIKEAIKRKYSIYSIGVNKIAV